MNFKRFGLLFILILAILLGGCVENNKAVLQQESKNTGSQQDGLRSDIDYLYSELEAGHKNLFFNISKEEFEEKIDQLKNEVGELSEDEVFCEMSKIVASVGDGHTCLVPEFEYVIPFRVYWFKDGIYIVSTSEQYKEILNKKIVSINGRKIDEVIEVIGEGISHENESQIKNVIANYLQSYKVLRGMNIINEKKFEIEIEDKNGVKKEVAIEALKHEEYSNENIIQDSMEIPLYLKNRDKGYWYTYLKEESTLYFNYGICSDMKGKTVKQVSDEVLDFIDENPVDKLVVDMRYNGGGNSRLLDEFIREVANSGINKEGHLFIIVGRATFSSAILNTLNFKQNTEAIFYGECTGGKPNHYGEVKSFSLPYTGYRVTYSSKYFQMYEEDIETFEPDEIIEPTFESYYQGKDLVMEKIIEY